MKQIIDPSHLAHAVSATLNNLSLILCRKAHDGRAGESDQQLLLDGNGIPFASIAIPSWLLAGGSSPPLLQGRAQSASYQLDLLD